MNKISQTVPLQFDTIFCPFKASEFDEALSFLSGEGFTGVELAIARPNEVDTDLLNKKLEASGLTATTISTGQAYALDGLCLCSFDEDVIKRSVEVINGHVNLSVQIGRPPVTIGLLRGKLEKGEKTALLENLRKSVSACAEYAEKRGVKLQLEPINKEETVLINNVYEALEFIASIGKPDSIGILYDTFHSNLEDNGMVGAIKAAAGKITDVHLADSHRGLPGYGDIDFAAVAEALRAINYTGPYALETLVVPDREFVNSNCFESIARIARGAK